MAFMRGSYNHAPFSSNAESDLRDMYQVGKNNGELRKMPFTDIELPMHPVHGIVNEGDYPVRELFKAKPDFYWQIGCYVITLFLDGKHHRRKIHYRRDEHVTKLLEDSGCIVKRYPFVRMTKGLLREIYEETRDIVNRYCEKWETMNGGKLY